MAKRDIFYSIEIDFDYCSLTFGNSPCTASFISGVCERKCFNTNPTCYDRENFSKTTITYKFCQPRANLPKGETIFPCVTSVSESTTTANIAGMDDTLNALGKIGTIEIEFADFSYHDRFPDKYWEERISGAAQLSGVGYDPETQGTFWGRTLARNKNYANRPLRKKTWRINEDGSTTLLNTELFIITNFEKMGYGQGVRVKAKDVTYLLSDDNSKAPIAIGGQLATDINANVGQSFDFLEIGAGDDYPTEGYGYIGSELVYYTRSGDTVTLTERGVSGTEASSHSAEDTFNPSFSVRDAKIYDVVYSLFVDYAGVDAAYIPYSDWQDEVDRWAGGVLLNADIMTPTGVSKLVGELMVLGVTVWWDRSAQEFKLKMNRPLDNDPLKVIDDNAAIISISHDDDDDGRINEVYFYHDQIDASAGTDEDNFINTRRYDNLDSKQPNSYGDTKIKSIVCRWLNGGNTSIARIISKRILRRFEDAPRTYSVTADYSYDGSIGDVFQINSDAVQNDDGSNAVELTQVVSRKEVDPGHKVELMLQRFEFDGRFAYFTENTRPLYTASTQAQKDRGAYFVDETTLKFGDTTGPFKFS